MIRLDVNFFRFFVIVCLFFFTDSNSMLFNQNFIMFDLRGPVKTNQLWNLNNCSQFFFSVELPTLRSENLSAKFQTLVRVFAPGPATSPARESLGSVVHIDQFMSMWNFMVQIVYGLFLNLCKSFPVVFKSFQFDDTCIF